MFSKALLIFCFSIVSLSFGKIEIPKNCTEPGPFCETCQSRVICFKNSDDTWEKRDPEKCVPHAYCTNGKCQTNPDPPDPFCDGTADLDVPCRSQGIYPHPFYADKFVFCVDYDGHGHLKSYTQQCEGGCGYNMETGLCDKQLNGDEGFPVPLCTEEGKQEALTNPSLYYDCEYYSVIKKVLYPFLDKCACGGVYSDYSCSPQSTSSGTTPASTTPDSTSSHSTPHHSARPHP